MKTKKTKKQVKKTMTLVNFILDKSGSMSSVCDATISGFNEYLKTLKKDGNEYNFSLTLFDTEVENRNVNVPIKDIEVLDTKTYQPSGMTALYDAVCKTVEAVKKNLKKGTKVLTVIMTDGEENSSQEYTQVQLKTTITSLEKTKMWSFVFLGANQDAWLTAQRFGMHAQNVSSFNATAAGAGATFSMMAANTAASAQSRDFTTGGAGGGGTFFSKEDQAKLKKTK